MSASSHTLAAAVAGARFADIAEQYAPDAVLESYVTGRRETAEGAQAIARAWPGAVGRGEVVRSQRTDLPGAVELDLQRAAASGPVRRVHRFELADGLVRRHVVYPAKPKEDPVLPEGCPAGVAPGTVRELVHDGLSGANLFRAELETGEPVVIKHIRPADDWMARATADPGREGLLYVEGVYDALPAAIGSAVIGAEAVDDGWVLLMRDLTADRRALLDSADPRSWERMLAAVHEMHEVLRGRLPSAALCSVSDRLRLFSPVRPFVEARGSDTLPKMLTTNWECFAEHGPADLVHEVFRLADDPSGLLAALAGSAPFTVLHGDFRPQNLALSPAGVTALDWGLACYGPPELEFVWFLSNTAWGEDQERDDLEAAWTRISGTARTSRAADLAVVYHAVMGEISFLLTESRNQVAGFARPAPATARWWLRRLDRALDRLGSLEPRRAELTAGV
ncbi:phosphotransferase [Amycolatopsis nivea]|uniref:phosphotransferase n=1 Tax=Amycolatopsis nivea TaxID=1644109 RepID=UPI00106F8921|nr:phosphotransferase [Amycolatopsis nivea]